MRRILVFAFACLLLTAATGSGETVDEGVKTAKMFAVKISVTSGDDLDLVGWLTTSPHEKAPLWVLLPMMGHTHTSYSPFIKMLYARFKTPDSTRTLNVVPNILALDLRGHGESVKKGTATISYRDMEPGDFAPYPGDVALMIEGALKDEKLDIDKSNIVIIGASIGANTSVMTAAQVAGVSKVVMLSPGENYRSLEPAAALSKFTGKVLIMAAEEDAYSKTSSEKLFDANKSKCTLKIYDGPYHGTDLIDNEPAAMKFLIDWLVK